jgi:hypothetical protein
MADLPNPADLRSQAIDSRRRAQAERDPDRRKAFLSLAGEYDKLAEAIETETRRLRLADEEA